MANVSARGLNVRLRVYMGRCWRFRKVLIAILDFDGSDVVHTSLSLVITDQLLLYFCFFKIEYMPDLTSLYCLFWAIHQAAVLILLPTLCPRCCTALMAVSLVCSLARLLLPFIPINVVQIPAVLLAVFRSNVGLFITHCIIAACLAHCGFPRPAPSLRYGEPARVYGLYIKGTNLPDYQHYGDFVIHHS
ncbi:hypothetical protein C8J56DRAFT_1170162 [Mycena floridula]|nr:hypothetical protein C8J56DRAFT_1170162 [Mycena floridula]